MGLAKVRKQVEGLFQTNNGYHFHYLGEIEDWKGWLFSLKKTGERKSRKSKAQKNFCFEIIGDGEKHYLIYRQVYALATKDKDKGIEEFYSTLHETVSKKQVMGNLQF